MDKKDKDVLKAFGIFILGIAGSILFFTNANNLYEWAFGGALVLAAIRALVFIVQQLTSKEISPEQKAAENEYELANIPRLDTPCKVSIQRPSSFMGAWVEVHVYLHGIEVGRLKNGKTINFSTDYATNEMHLIYVPAGNEVKVNFPAMAGGIINLSFDYRKKTIEQISHSIGK